MRCTVRDIYAIIDRFAPFDTAEAWDSVGLLVGGMDRPVEAVLTALDATPAVVAEAGRLGAQLLVTHHPVLFSPLRRLDEANPEAALLCDMVRSGLSMIAAHTNLDRADGGVNDALAGRLGWPVFAREGFLLLGQWERPRELAEVQSEIARALNTQAIRYGNGGLALKTFALCSGAGGSEVARAAEFGAQVLVTGEIKHHEALEAMQRGIAVLACGHRATEICAADLLCSHLQSETNKVELKVRVSQSQVDPFA